MRKIIVICVATAAFLLALGIAIYPIISAYYSEKHQSYIHTSYQEELGQADQAEIDAARAAAIAYNKAIVPGSHLIGAYSQEAMELALAGYESQLDLLGLGIMGYVQIPAIDVTLPIYHGTEHTTLERGVGHLVGSSLPVGGESTHTVLTAHSGMVSQKMFSDLPQMQIGDVFYIEVLDEILAYRVEQINTVLPHETKLLEIVTGEDRCTLVTCTPFGVNTHRLLVQGVRVPYLQTEQSELPAAQESSGSIWEQEYINGIVWGLGIILACACVAGTVKLIRRKNETAS